MIYHFTKKLALGASLYALSVLAQAQIVQSPLFKSGAVLQQGVTVPVWGTAKAGDSIKVQFNTNTAKGKVSTDGSWEVQLPSMLAGGPYNMLIKTNSDSVKLTDVYVGDVWMLAGQSNMEWKVSQDKNSTSLVAGANNQLIREFAIPKGLSKELSNDLPTGTTWSAATSANVGSFSAVGYYFAKNLQPNVNIPVGLLKAAYGGARIEAFMSEDMLGFDEDFTVLQAANYYAERQPTMIYNKMINPLLKFPIKGIVWYQGESNADNLEDAKSYGSYLNNMINSYRENFGLGNIPFVIVQLPNNGTIYGENAPQTWDAWPQIRKCQDEATSLPEVYEVVTIDAGDVDIHPTDKHLVGERIALMVRNEVYGQNVNAYSPRYASHTKLTGGAVEITFANVGTGLKTIDGDTVRWFSIAGAEGKLVRAKAKITGTNTVEVSSASVSSPEIIRYAWEYNPDSVNLYNSANLPAAPFYINVNPQAYALKSFTANKTSIERGNGIFLSWTTYGASAITLNGMPVESISGITVYPTDTTAYVLKTVNKNDATDVDSVVITINVQNPQPTISLSSSKGSAIGPNSVTVISANAVAPAGGLVKKVTFYVDNAVVAVDSVAPYEYNFSKATTGTYKLTGLVEDNLGQTKLSSALNILVTTLKVYTYEAEEAEYTGDTEILTQAGASKGKMLAVKQTWTVKFPAVVAPTEGKYQLTIGYALNYEGPKTQTMTVNGVSQSVVFTTLDASKVVQQMNVDVTLKAGANEIVFTPSWSWQSFDFISVAVDSSAAIPPTVKLSTSASATITPNASVSLSATAIAPSDTVSKVDFYANSTLVSSDATAPYAATWTPTTSGTYTLKAILYTKDGQTDTSNTYSVTVTDMKIVKLEAETATLTTATVVSSTTASNGKYVDAQAAWNIAFNNVIVPTAGSYEITVGYMLNYEGPKNQNMVVNGVSKEVTFTAANKTDWTTTKFTVTLNAGSNTISFNQSWGWMSFDYISYLVPNDGVDVKDVTYENASMKLFQNYPNPCSDKTTVVYELTQSGDVEIDVLDARGTLVAHKNLGNGSVGMNEYELNIQNFNAGLYIMKLSQNGKVVSRTLSVE